jgi:hypothetical protein
MSTVANAAAMVRLTVGVQQQAALDQGAVIQRDEHCPLWTLDGPGQAGQRGRH